MSAKSWEEELIADLKTRQAEDANGGAATRDVLEAGFHALLEAFQGAISRVSEGLGATVAATGARQDHRLRWNYGSHSMAVRLDAEAGKIFLSVDVGREVLLEELTIRAGMIVDARHQTASVEDLARRFVSRLFRGA